MKSRRVLILTIAAWLLLPIICLAARATWNHKVRPKLPLQEALAMAREKLNAEEGLAHDAEKYYCLSGGLARTRFKGGDWTFAFASEDGSRRWVILSLDKEAIILKEPPEY